MKALTQPLRDEHRDLLPHLEHILALADDIEEGPNPKLVDRVGRIHGFLADHLLDHARVEEEALYPVVAQAMGAPEATATMSRDHVEIGRLLDELGALSREVRDGTVSRAHARKLRRILYGVHAVVRLHFLKEEEVYLTLLDERLTEAEARALVTALERAARRS